jgi:antitoxin CptB
LDIEIRRRRAAYRAAHRGTKEMDWLLGRYATARLDTMDEDALTVFERVLSLPDPQLQGWIFDPQASAKAIWRQRSATCAVFMASTAPDPR